MFSGLTLTKAASGYTILVSSSGFSAVTANPITVNPASASQVVITEQPPSSVTAGNGFGLQATIEDPYDNVETADKSPVTVALASNPPGTTLGGMLSVAPIQGVADFSGLTLNTAASGYSLQVAAGMLSSTTGAFTVIPAAPTKLVVAAAPPDSLSAGTAFGLTVDVEDPYDNLAPLSGAAQRLDWSRTCRRNPGRPGHRDSRRRAWRLSPRWRSHGPATTTSGFRRRITPSGDQPDHRHSRGNQRARS